MKSGQGQERCEGTRLIARHLEDLAPQLCHVGHFLQQVLQPLLSGVGDVADHICRQLAHAKLLPCHNRCGETFRGGSDGGGPRHPRASPISIALWLSRDGDRKVSSLQERVTVPTSSELVAKMLALSSVRLTPAMEATSLMSSSSSLSDGRDIKEGSSEATRSRVSGHKLADPEQRGRS